MSLQIPDQTMKIKKLQKIVIKMVQESGASEEKEQLRAKLMDKVKPSKDSIILAFSFHMLMH